MPVAITMPATYLKVALLHELQYRAHLVLQLIHTTASLTLALVALDAVFGHGQQLNGWSRADLLVVVGFFLAVNGIVSTVIQPGLNQLMEQVRKGTLDFVLLKPADSQLVVTFQSINPWKLVDVIAGVGVIAYGVRAGDGAVTAHAIATCAALTALGLICLYSAWIAIASLSFWFVRVGELLEIAHCVLDSGRWPVAIYPPLLRNVLTFVVPIGLSVSIPASALTSGVGGTVLPASVASAAAMTLVARAAWSIGLRNYSGASS